MFKALISENEIRWTISLFIRIAIGVAVIGVIVGFSAMRSISAPALTPTLEMTATLPPTETPTVFATATQEATPTSAPTIAPPTLTPTPRPFSSGPFTYGVSFGGRPLRAYRLGTGPSARAIIGGIHGGYEWNTVDLVSKTLEHLQADPALVPDDVTLYVIPCANPDGYAAGTDRVHGRMNGNGVDLNRNWDYQWQMTATHGTRPVSAGTAPFSEPETANLRDFILNRDIELVIFYHSAMHKIFSGAERDNCFTDELAEMMARETGYPHDTGGVPGQITTGDSIDYLSTQGIAGIEIELSNHQDIEWERNWAGIRAFLTWQIPNQQMTPPPPSEDHAGYITHTVQPGEVLSSIAEQYGVSVDALMYINGVSDPHLIQVGQELLVPAAGREGNE
jgi:LysM repeat protein